MTVKTTRATYAVPDSITEDESHVDVMAVGMMKGVSSTELTVVAITRVRRVSDPKPMSRASTASIDNPSMMTSYSITRLAHIGGT